MVLQRLLKGNIGKTSLTGVYNAKKLSHAMPKCTLRPWTREEGLEGVVGVDKNGHFRTCMYLYPSLQPIRTNRTDTNKPLLTQSVKDLYMHFSMTWLNCKHIMLNFAKAVTDSFMN